MNCNTSDYPLDVLDTFQMNRVLRHRLRNHCAGIKLTMESLQRKKEEGLADAFSNRAPLIVAEVDELVSFTHRGDLIFDTLPSPQPMAFNVIISEILDSFPSKYPLCSIDVDGEVLTQTVTHGSYLKTILTEILNNAAEAAGSGGDVKLVWKAEDNLVELAVVNTGRPWDSTKVPANPPIPYMTTKGGKHDGLGLAIAWRFALAADAVMEIHNDLPDFVAVKVSEFKLEEGA